MADREVGEIDINICRYSCTLRPSLLVRLKPYVSPDVVIDCPPSMLFLSIYIRLNSLVLYTSGAQEHGAKSNGNNCEFETRGKNRGPVISDPENPFSLFVKQALWDAFPHDFECRLVSVAQIAVL